MRTRQRAADQAGLDKGGDLDGAAQLALGSLPAEDPTGAPVDASLSMPQQDSAESSDLEILPAPQRPALDKNSSAGCVSRAPTNTAAMRHKIVLISSSDDVNGSDDAPPLASKPLASSSSMPSMPAAQSRHASIDNKPSLSPRPSSSAKAARGKKAVSAAPVMETGGESDDLDDFFTRKKPVMARRRPGKRMASPDKAVPSSSKDSPAKQRATSPSSSSIDGVSEDEGLIDESLAAARQVTLPAWARGNRTNLTTSGPRASDGRTTNRKRRRLDVNSDEERVEEAKRQAERARAEAEESDDSLLGTGSKRKKDETEEKARSLTPPTQLSADFVRSALADVRAAIMGSSPVAASLKSSPPLPSSEDEDDFAALDPALQQIRQAMLGRRTATAVSDGLGAEGSRAFRSPSRGDDPENAVEVTIRISLVMDPDLPASERARQGYERVMPVACAASEQFSTVFNEIAASRGIPVEDLVFVYRVRQVFPFGTPASLRIQESADLRGYTRELWHKMEKRRLDVATQSAAQPRNTTPPMLPPPDEELTDGAAKATLANGEDAPDGSPQASGLFRITIRGSRTQSLGLAVKPTTTLSALLSKYCKKYAVPPDRMSKMWLEYDGERLDLGKRLEDYGDEIEDEETIDIGEPK